MNNNGYLGMTILTIKHINLSSYEKIPLCESCSRVENPYH